MRREQTPGRLPDYVQPGVRILFVGINPGLRSAALGHHFAGTSNRFWKLLFDSGLVDEPLSYGEDWRLPEWRLGLTNIIGRSSAGIAELSPLEYQAGLAELERKIRRTRPRTIALLGVTIYRMLFRNLCLSNVLDLGPTRARLAGAPVFLLPNPSGRNAHYSYTQMLTAFIALRNQANRPSRLER
ncbi:MAG TPA: mismatch-specific DNA-glycosylase [Nitrospira sp.]|nr:mismatch-specific DNA-glycosylase [Nitrospira sp.]